MEKTTKNERYKIKKYIKDIPKDTFFKLKFTDNVEWNTHVTYKDKTIATYRDGAFTLAEEFIEGAEKAIEILKSEGIIPSSSIDFFKNKKGLSFKQIENAQYILSKIRNKTPKKYMSGDFYSYIKDTARRIYLGYGNQNETTGLSHENYEQLARLKKESLEKNYRITKLRIAEVLTKIEE